MPTRIKGRTEKAVEITLADDLRKGMRNAVAYAQGARAGAVKHVVYVPKRTDVRALRRKLGLSQAGFAARFGVSPATVRNWEQGRRQPEGPARVLLTIIEREPEAVARALSR